MQRFKAWRGQPSQMAPLSDEGHECECCHTSFQGNYCPRCGQSWRIGRYSFKTAMLGFLNVWGLGNRGMFRTIRDLILRPGYMIRDYLKGMQMAYFPPFQMFFILAAISILVTHGFNIKGETYAERAKNISTEETIRQVENEELVDSQQKQDELQNEGEDASYKIENKIPTRIFQFIERFNNRFPSVLALFLLFCVSGFLYLFFRHCPNIPDLRYSEFFISLVYADNMYSIYSIVLCFLGLPGLATSAVVLVLVPLKQLSGYSWTRTILKTVAAFLIMFVLFIAAIVGLVFAVVGYEAFKG